MAGICISGGDMHKITRTFLFAVIALISTPSFAESERATAEEAVKFVKFSVAYLKKHGQKKAFADFADTTNRQFHDRDLYLFVYDFKGNNVAHGNNPKMVGKNLLELRDADGTPSFAALSKWPARRGVAGSIICGPIQSRRRWNESRVTSNGWATLSSAPEFTSQ
jgi:hypothetical protein